MIQQSETSFLINHLTDAAQNLSIEMFIDQEGESVEWENLPMSLVTMLPQERDSFEDLTKYPLAYLNMALAQQFEESEGLRPQAEYTKLLKESIEVSETSPGGEYKSV